MSPLRDRECDWTLLLYACRPYGTRSTAGAADFLNAHALKIWFRMFQKVVMAYMHVARGIELQSALSQSKMGHAIQSLRLETNRRRHLRLTPQADCKSALRIMTGEKCRFG